MSVAELQRAELQEQKSFKDFCVFFDDSKKDADVDASFVGVRIENGEPQFHFPVGYSPASSADCEKLDERELRRDFLCLLRLLSDNDLMQGSVAKDAEFVNSMDFPVQAYMKVLDSFLERGYFFETEIQYKNASSGKVNWNRTIKMMQPRLVQNENGEHSVIYLDLIRRCLNHNEDSLITHVHKYCVYDAVKKLGPLYGLFVECVDQPELQFNYSLFAGVLQEKLSRTFDDRHIDLFESLLQIVEYIDRKNPMGEDSTEDTRFGVNKFAPVWERLIENIFGTENQKDYYPHCHWNLGGAGSRDADVHNTMRPDTVMKVGEGANSETFILDAKYYKHCVSGANFPASDSITKQLAYAEYAENVKGLDGSLIYNAFILPYCATEKSEYLYGMKRFGFAYGDWNNPDAANAKPYYRIAGIMLDVKSVMRSYGKNASAQKEMAELVKGISRQ